MSTTLTYHGKFILLIKDKKTFFDKTENSLHYSSIKSLERFLRKEARETANSLILFWSRKMKISPPSKIFIRRSKYVWGSYSYRDNININIRIVALPKEIQEYLVLHELTHKLVSNHSKKFWKILERYIERPKEKDRILNKYHIITMRDYIWRKIMNL